MEWTKEQKQAIDFRGDKSVLLAAAAGSGKTAVLVQRIIEKIKDKENPVSVSDLVVLTFTEAAASEMKRKIQRAIKKALAEDPKNKHLKRQSLLVHSAAISTVDAFCKARLKEFVHQTDLPADFSIVSQTEAALILKSAVNRVMEKYYERADLLPSFRALCESCGSAKSDFALRELLTNLFLFSQSMPYPAEWLCRSARAYKPGGGEENACRKEVLSELCADIKEAALLCLETVSALPADHKYYIFYEAETKKLLSLCAALEESGFKGGISEIIEFKLPGKVRVQKTYPEEERKADLLRELYSKKLDGLKGVLSAEKGETEELAQSAYQRIKTLKNIILAIGREFKRQKRAKSYLDFSDLEHEFLSLISDREHNPTSVALSLRKKYSEILLDEYQDTNNVQEEIFRLISRDGKNIFMVGDLKQSIYKFRNAVPKLFSDKYELYKKSGESGELIRLFKNFRSRREVIDAVNGIFSGIMTKNCGDVLYNEEEYLINGAEYPPPIGGESFSAEYRLIKFSDESDKKPVSEDIRIAEARLIAKRIGELIKEGFHIFDTSLEKQRRAEYKDIVILTSNNSAAELIAEVCAECGVPVYAKTGRGYLSSPEVEIILSLLETIDNPYQDIPLIAAMRSGIFGFSAEELAKIRIPHKEGYFYDAVLKAAESGNAKAEFFVSELEALREFSKTASIYRLLIHIFQRYNYFAMVSSFVNPDLRIANLRLFSERAAEFEKTKLSGLFGFLSYLESVREEKQDLLPAKTVSEGENVVRIMTVHKSKGLEFPIVFLADTSRAFNTEDLNKKILRHERGGIALCGYDAEDKIIYPSSQKEIIKRLEKKELFSEQIRLLYVALTRAREKLIITAAADVNPKKMQNPIYGENKKPSGAYLKSLSCFRDLISAVCLTHKNAKEIRELFSLDEDIINPRLDFPLEVHLDWTEDIEAGFEMPEEETGSEAPEELKAAKEKAELILSYDLPKEEKVPLKMAVSEVKRRLSDEHEYVPRLLGGKNIYLKSKSELSAAEIGTVTHFILQHISEKEIFSKEDFFGAAEEMQKKGIISKSQLDAADLDAAADFVLSPLGKRMKKSGAVFKEFSFYSEKAAGDIFSELEGEKRETGILLQGTVDCFFEENGELVLLDYKTDGISADEAEKRAEQYKIQIDCYKEAIEKIFEKKVKESYICFLNCRRQIKIK